MIIVYLTTHHQFLSLYIANTTAFNYYNVVMSAEGNDSIEFGVKFVPAMCHAKPDPFGNCELHGPVWGIHFTPGYLFWPPIPKRVCYRPCLTGGRCRPSCCETRCIKRYVWECDLDSYSCFSHGQEDVCYEHHNACKCACAQSYPLCYF